jgi:uncharacterized lipoprotein YehR (DUF1307 family)
MRRINMKKNLLVGLLVVVMCFALTGCGKSESKDAKKAVEQGKSGENTVSSGNKLYTTEDRLVFNANDVYYIVIDFGNDGYATSLKWMYNYEDSATAKKMVSIIKANLDETDDIKSVAQDGEYVVVDYEKPVFEDLDRESAEMGFKMYPKVEKE